MRARLMSPSPLRAPALAMSLGLALWVGMSACSGGGGGDDDDEDVVADAGGDDAEDAAADDGGSGGEDVVTDASPGEDAGQPTDAGPDGDVNDAGGEPDTEDGGVLPDDGGPGPEDIGADVSLPECVTQADCALPPGTPACKQATCAAGVCGVATKPGACCADADCDDGVECTQDSCNVETLACSSTPIPNCCSGKQTLLQLGFEQGAGPLSLSAGADNGNVGWGVSSAAAWQGSQSLYFGNPCGSYDSSETLASGCVSEGPAEAVSGDALSPELNLPADKQSIVHFFVQLDTEPPVLDSLPEGQCASGCPGGSQCVAVGGNGQCVPENDLLRLDVLDVATGKATVMFTSDQLGKKTDGWQHVAADLGAFAGKAVRLRWRFDSVTALDNGYGGVHIDAVVVETVCAVAGTLCGDAALCQDDGDACSVDACTTFTNDASAGLCFHDPAPACCQSAADCDDGDGCTVDACDGNACKHVPDSGKPGCCAPADLWAADFVGQTLATFTALDANSAAVKWRVDPTGGPDGSPALAFGEADLSGYADPSLPSGVGPKATLCGPPVVLDASDGHALATFALWLDTEWSLVPPGQYLNPAVPGQPKSDELRVLVAVNGVFHPVWSSDSIAGHTGGQWLPVTAVLDPWIGKQAQLCLTFDAGDDQVNGGLGVRVDDIVVARTCSKAPCYFDSDCAGEVTCGPCAAPVCLPGGCACKAIDGCCTADPQCNDQNPCTLDVCNTVIKTCVNTAIDGCCTQDGDCDDGDPCTNELCNVATKQCLVSGPQPDCP